MTHLYARPTPGATRDRLYDIARHRHLVAAARLFLGSLLVYAAVAMIYGCSGGSARVTASGTGGARASSASASSSGLGSGGKTSGGGPVPNADADESGSRIKAQRYVASDGTIAFVQWFDTMLGAICSWQIAEDGAVRCLPLPKAAENAYQDSACTQPVVLFTTPTPANCMPPVPAYYVTEVSLGCAIGYAGRSVGMALNLTSVYVKNAGVCMPGSLAAGLAAYPFTPIPASAFVSAMLIQDKDGGA